MLRAYKAKGPVHPRLRGEHKLALNNPRPRGPTPGMEKAAAAARIAKAHRRASDVLPVIDQIRSTGATTLAAIAAELRRMDVPTPSGNGSWHAATVARIVASGRPGG